MSDISEQYIELDYSTNNLIKDMLIYFCKFHQLEPIEEYQEKLKNAMDKGLDIRVLIAEKDTFGADKIKLLLEMY